MYKVYVWTNNITGLRYVGTTGTSMEKRAGTDGYHYQGSPRFYNAIQKYGFSNFSYEILADNLTKEAAADLEKRYIQEFDTMNPEHGYNLQEGGFPDQVPDSNSERVLRISATLKEQRASTEYRAVMSQRMKRLWDDPEKRKVMLRKRAGKYSGRHPIAVFCDETGEVYPDMHVAAKALNMCVSNVSSGFKHQDVIVVGKRKGTPYTLRKVKVHVKEGELLEASAGNAGGNQQPSLEQQEFGF